MNRLVKFGSYFIILVIASTIYLACKKSVIVLSSPTNGKSTAVFNKTLGYDTLTDQEGNGYKTIIIGEQLWMAENLRTTIYRNGDPIPNITNPSTWMSDTTGAYCNYGNSKDLAAIATYGRLYNWYAINDPRQIAPKGWHVPSWDEWSKLLSSPSNAALMWISSWEFKEDSTSHWQFPNPGATNYTGFTGLPGGACYGNFSDLGIYGNWWTTDVESILKSAMFVRFNNADSRIRNDWAHYYSGLSVRLVKDK